MDQGNVKVRAITASLRKSPSDFGKARVTDQAAGSRMDIRFHLGTRAMLRLGLSQLVWGKSRSDFGKARFRDQADGSQQKGSDSSGDQGNVKVKALTASVGQIRIRFRQGSG